MSAISQTSSPEQARLLGVVVLVDRVVEPLQCRAVGREVARFLSVAGATALAGGGGFAGGSPPGGALAGAPESVGAIPAAAAPAPGPNKPVSASPTVGP